MTDDGRNHVRDVRKNDHEDDCKNDGPGDG
jgi:hypothetical protein